MNAITINENIDLLHLLFLGTVSILLLLLSGMASASEVAFFSLSSRDQQSMRSEGDGRDQAILSLLEDVDSLLATILVTNNLVNICIVILTSNIIDTIFTFHSATFEFVVKSVLVTFLLLRVLAQRRWVSAKWFTTR